MLLGMTRGSSRIATAAIAAAFVACHSGHTLPLIPALDPVSWNSAPEFCTLVRWEDGDTPYVDCGAGAGPVRLLDIDTAESGFDDNSTKRGFWQAKLWQLPVDAVFACGRRATARAREICPDGTQVELRGRERDKYDRRLAYLRCLDVEVNAKLVREGHAGRYAYPKDPERPTLCERGF